jgi:uncharacterized protein YybS (DUF2232 family)
MVVRLRKCKRDNWQVLLLRIKWYFKSNSVKTTRYLVYRVVIKNTFLVFSHQTIVGMKLLTRFLFILTWTILSICIVDVLCENQKEFAEHVIKGIEKDNSKEVWIFKQWEQVNFSMSWWWGPLCITMPKASKPLKSPGGLMS